MRPSRNRNKPESRVPRNNVPSGVSAIDNTIELGLGASLIRSKRSPRHAISPLTCAYTSSSPLLPTVMAVTATSRGSVAKGTLSKPGVATAQQCRPIGAQPEAAARVHHHAEDVRAAGRNGLLARLQPELRAVEADEAALRAQPQVAVLSLGDRVDPAARKAVLALQLSRW